MPAMSAPRIALLQCDAVWEPLRSAHGDYPDLFGKLFAAAGASPPLAILRADRGELPASPTEYDVYLVSGARAGVYAAEDWIAELAGFVRAARAAGRKLLGICFGHQLLAHALGGHAERAAGGWGLGHIEHRLAGTPAWLDGASTPVFRLPMVHQDQVVALPPGAELLASTGHCAFAAFVLGERVLGLQGHPEFESALMHDLTHDRLFDGQPALRAAALPTYAQPADSILVARWMLRFMGVPA